MQVLTRSRQPRPEARVAFDLLVEMIEGKGRLDEGAYYDRISRFVALLQRVSGKMVRWKWDFNPEEIKEIAGALPYGMERLRSGQIFQHPCNGEGLEQGILWDGSRAFVGRPPARYLKNLFFDIAFDLLIEIGPWLRLCQREGCGRLFLYRRPKQAYCSESCAQRVRMGRFLEQGKVKSSKRTSKSSGPKRRQQARAG
jgi:hypothetical protein